MRNYRKSVESLNEEWIKKQRDEEISKKMMAKNHKEYLQIQKKIKVKQQKKMFMDKLKEQEYQKQAIRLEHQQINAWAEAQIEKFREQVMGFLWGLLRGF